MLLIILLAKIKLNRRALEHAFGLAGRLVDYSWYATVCY